MSSVRSARSWRAALAGFASSAAAGVARSPTRAPTRRASTGRRTDSVSVRCRRPLNRGGAMRVGVLTGGGDCPGLNAVIRAVVRKGERIHGDEFVGFLDGWKGVIEG